MLYPKSLFRFQLLSFHFEFLYSQVTLCLVSESIVHSVSPGLLWRMMLPVRIIPSATSTNRSHSILVCYTIRGAPHVGHRGIFTTAGLRASQSIPLPWFRRSASHLSRGNHGASYKIKRIRVSHLSLLHDHPRIGLAQPSHIIIDNQREPGGSPRGSQWRHDKVLSEWQIRWVLVGDKEKCSQNVDSNAWFSL